MPNNQLFQMTEKPKPPRSRFDLSHAVKGTYDMGILYPVQCNVMIPGDVFNISHSIQARMMPGVCPVLDPITVYFHVFKIPIRILDENFPEFITGGEDGTNSYTVPTWTPTDNSVGSTWDHLGFPVGVTPTGMLPIIYPLYAMNMVYNEYYRDENLIAEVALTDEDLKRRAWEKDYFNSSSPVQQKGTAPSFPISGSSSAVFTGDPTTSGASGLSFGQRGTTPNIVLSSAGSFLPSIEALNNSNTVDFSTATSFSLNDFRLAAVAQQYMELMQRTGARYPEYLEAIFGEKPRDLRLQIPSYEGGSAFPVIISEVLQTGETGTTPQGNLAGHGIAAGGMRACTVRAEEWSICLTLMSIMPESTYNSQGVPREWTPETKEDWYNPLYAHLAEQPVYQGELYATGVSSENTAVLGYQGRWDHHRQIPNRTAGLMRTDFDEWTIARQFASAPLLNQSFIECNPRDDFLAVPSEPAFIVEVGNNILATRPLPALASPGLRRI